MGGRRYICTHCEKSKYVYFGCGNSRCPKCQGIKRLQWQDKISRLLFECPYVHMVFTMPRELQSLARRNPSKVYSCLMRSAWQSLKNCCVDQRNLGAVPGAVMVLHTFGSDLKYHIHVHALVSFGGMTKQGEWMWPTDRNKLVRYRQIRNEYRSTFLRNLEKIYGDLTTRNSFEALTKGLYKKAWCVHAESPTSSTKHVREYLGRYINRIGLSKKRFLYNPDNQTVHLQFKDYRNKDKKTNETPIATKTMHPLAAIHQIMQHCLPKYFQKCRYYGLHSSASSKKYKELIPKSIKNNNTTIRTMFQIITQLLGIEEIKCEECQNKEFLVEDIPAKKDWWKAPHPKTPRSPPNQLKHMKSLRNAAMRNGTLMQKI